jgi:hypothetical protein
VGGYYFAKSKINSARILNKIKVRFFDIRFREFARMGVNNKLQ